MVVYEQCQDKDCIARGECKDCNECGAPPGYANRKCSGCCFCL